MAARAEPHAAPAQPDAGTPGGVVVGGKGEYVVVARRYRPQTFAELIGQEQVARALTNAISANRVGHAYLFTGARGVGKTSAARILAKALDCQDGPAAVPCNECDICLSVSRGSDIDVIEIDGASNRGIDEIRQLRQNVNIRPSRARFKIYIIDEVHMLTKEAFNALLKTLEEPPEHVKFIFCTTEATKIPITILSRCQRFDFAGIRASSIQARLAQIVAAEGVAAEPEALALLARRAGGSMRDSQSLLEQLLSFGHERITAADVHALLGTAGDVRLAGLARRMADRDGARALAEFDQALNEGVDVGQLLEQLLGYFRDCMATAVGCPADDLLYTAAADYPELVSLAKRLGLETILACVQILDHTLARLRYSSQARTLAEVAIVRICSLENLQELTGLIGQLRGEAGPLQLPTATEPQSVERPAQTNPSRESLADEVAAKKKSTLAATVPKGSSNGGQPAFVVSNASPGQVTLTPDMLPAIWQQALAGVSDMLAENAARSESVLLASTTAAGAQPGTIENGSRQAASPATLAPKRLVVSFPAKYNSCKLFCERPEQMGQLERALAEVVGGMVKVEFAVLEPTIASEPARRVVSPRQRLAEKAEHPLVRRAAELFDARPTRVEEPEASGAAGPTSTPCK